MPLYQLSLEDYKMFEDMHHIYSLYPERLLKWWFASVFSSCKERYSFAIHLGITTNFSSSTRNLGNLNEDENKSLFTQIEEKCVKADYNDVKICICNGPTIYSTVVFTRIPENEVL